MSVTIEMVAGTTSARVIADGLVILRVAMVGPGIAEVSTTGETAHAEAQHIRPWLIGYWDQLRDRAGLIFPEGVDASGEVLAQHWDTHRRLWLAENAV